MIQNMNFFVSFFVSLCLIGTVCQCLPCPGQFLPVAIQLDQVDFVPPSNPNNTKTHEQNLVVPSKPEVSNLLIPPEEEQQNVRLTDLLLPEEISKIENTSLPVRNIIAKIISGFILKNETNKPNISSTTPASQHIMKIANNAKESSTDLWPTTTATTTTEKQPAVITIQKATKNRKRKIKTRPEIVLIQENPSWHLKTINEQPANEVLATDKASQARDLKDETTESAVIKVKRIS